MIFSRRSSAYCSGLKSASICSMLFFMRLFSSASISSSCGVDVLIGKYFFGVMQGDQGQRSLRAFDRDEILTLMQHEFGEPGFVGAAHHLDQQPISLFAPFRRNEIIRVIIIDRIHFLHIDELDDLDGAAPFGRHGFQFLVRYQDVFVGSDFVSPDNLLRGDQHFFFGTEHSSGQGGIIFAVERRKETRPGSTALTNCTGIATRLKLIVPLHIPCTAISFLGLKTA